MSVGAAVTICSAAHYSKLADFKQQHQQQI
jgi:hypothetical protein